MLHDRACTVLRATHHLSPASGTSLTRPPSQSPRPPPPFMLDMADHSVPSRTTSGAPTSSLQNLLSGRTATFVSLSSCLPSNSPPYRLDQRVTHVNALKTRSQAHQALVTRPLQIHAIPDRCSVVTWPLLCWGSQPPYKTHLHLDHLPGVPLGPPSTPIPGPCPISHLLSTGSTSLLQQMGTWPCHQEPSRPTCGHSGNTQIPRPKPPATQTRTEFLARLSTHSAPVSPSPTWSLASSVSVKLS